MSTQIKMDRSKPFSQVAGDRLPDDPHYKVHYWQDGFPFDANGVLVEDDGKNAPWSALNSDQKPVVHHPLWNELMRTRLRKKLERMEKVVTPEQEIQGATEESPDEIKRAVAADVNLGMWARGEANYPTWAVLQAATERRKKRYVKIGELVHDITTPPNHILREDELCPSLRKYLEPATAA